MPVNFNASFQNAAFGSFFSMLAQPECRQTKNAPFALFELSGISHDEAPLQQAVIFPHRGDWAVDAISFEFRDIFGLCSVSWKQATDGQIRIAPAPESTPDWPILVSSTRAGESIEHVENRQGDYLDLKPYHPSDGARRIVWKLFAKTKELVARQPERSVDPEGECYMFALIPTIDDGAAFATVEYARALQQQDCDVVCSCLGAGGQPFLNIAEEPLIKFAFRAIQSDSAQQEIDQFISHIKGAATDSSIVKLIITVGDSLFNGKTYDPALVAVGACCETNGITPHFLLAKPQSTNVGKRFESNTADFFRYCADRSWEVSY